MFFFFKQKTAYEMLRSLVGSEMCISDSSKIIPHTGVVAKSSNLKSCLDYSQSKYH